jgi:hypothetical protein
MRRYLIGAWPLLGLPAAVVVGQWPAPSLVSTSGFADADPMLLFIKVVVLVVLRTLQG